MVIVCHNFKTMSQDYYILKTHMLTHRFGINIYISIVVRLLPTLPRIILGHKDLLSYIYGCQAQRGIRVINCFCHFQLHRVMNHGCLPSNP